MRTKARDTDVWSLDTDALCGICWSVWQMQLARILATISDALAFVSGLAP